VQIIIRISPRIRSDHQAQGFGVASRDERQRVKSEDERGARSSSVKLRGGALADQRENRAAPAGAERSAAAARSLCTIDRCGGRSGTSSNGKGPRRDAPGLVGDGDDASPGRRVAHPGDQAAPAHTEDAAHARRYGVRRPSASVRQIEDGKIKVDQGEVLARSRRADDVSGFVRARRRGGAGAARGTAIASMPTSRSPPMARSVGSMATERMGAEPLRFLAFCAGSPPPTDRARRAFAQGIFQRAIEARPKTG
jgi:hypothetical protein